MTIALLLAPSLLAPAASTRAGDPCPDLQRVQGIGLACLRAPGLFEVFDQAGASLGFTHGPDPACGVECAGAPVLTAQSGSAIACVEGAPGEAYVRVIYARASDDLDRSSTIDPTLRDLVAGSAQTIDEAAIATHDRLSLRVRCVDGAIAIDHVTLPTVAASTDFSTIVSDLRAMGYNDPLQKHWVFYDDATQCPCLGIAHIYQDDRDILDNANNGAAGSQPMFAVIFNSEAVRPMLHELAHTLGAVQDGAPASTLAAHCYDGRDTMCYNDGGPRGGLYTVNACTVEVFDCNKNTYCNAYPPAGSWLASHWQVCSRHSRYLVYPPNAPPVMEALGCAPSPSYPGETVTCTFRASDAAPAVSYSISWGDGATTRVPQTGTMAPGVDVSASRTFTAEGAMAISVEATDIGHPPMTSAPRTLDHMVLTANVGPTVSSIDCTPAAPLEDEDVSCALSSSDIHPVAYTVDWGDGAPIVRAPATGFAPAGSSVVVSHPYRIGGSYTIRVNASDEGRPPLAGPVRTQDLAIVDDNEAPVMVGLTCTTTRAKPNAIVRCDFRAQDDSFRHRYVIDWGDGATNETPFVAAGTQQSAWHSYPTEGPRTVGVIAIDDGAPERTSAARTLLMRVDLDQEPPNFEIWHPLRGGVYRGCDEVVRDPRANTTPVMLEKGCVKIAISDGDDGSGVYVVEVRYHGQMIVPRYHPPGIFNMEFAIPRFEQDLEITIRATDYKGNVRQQTFPVHAFDLNG